MDETSVRACHTDWLEIQWYKLHTPTYNRHSAKLSLARVKQKAVVGTTTKKLASTTTTANVQIKKLIH